MQRKIARASAPKGFRRSEGPFKEVPAGFREYQDVSGAFMRFQNPFRRLTEFPGVVRALKGVSEAFTSHIRLLDVSATVVFKTNLQF